MSASYIKNSRCILRNIEHIAPCACWWSEHWCSGIADSLHIQVVCIVVWMQDVGTIVRSVLTILLDQRTKQHLQMAARETALRLNPSAIADRLSSLQPDTAPKNTLRLCF